MTTMDELNPDETNKGHRGKPTMLEPHTKSYRQPGLTRNGRGGLPQRRTQSKWSSLKISIPGTLCGLNRLYLRLYITCAYTYSYMHTMIIMNKRDQEFEGDQGGVFKRVWKEEREGRNVIIL